MGKINPQADCCLPNDVSPVAGLDIGRQKPCSTSQRHTAAELISISGGWFRMGADDGPHPQDGEGPARDVFVAPYSLAVTAVTVAEFYEFVRATSYRTVAERAGTSFVFCAFCNRDLDYPAPVQAPWWRQVSGACWFAPDGPESSIEHRLDHPVTHIARQDALAYCQWSAMRLPTEAEWEYGARGGRCHQPFPWGATLEQDGMHHCNVWQGDFPFSTDQRDGYTGCAPVTAYRPNDFGLYNMIGNVWEWTADRFTNLHSPHPVRNPSGPLNGGRYVAKGGSYLCHASYCTRYRTSSRQSLPPDTTTGNLGFRLARSPKSQKA